MVSASSASNKTLVLYGPLSHAGHTQQKQRSRLACEEHRIGNTTLTSRIQIGFPPELSCNQRRRRSRSLSSQPSLVDRDSTLGNLQDKLKDVVIRYCRLLW